MRTAPPHLTLLTSHSNTCVRIEYECLLPGSWKIFPQILFDRLFYVNHPSSSVVAGTSDAGELDSENLRSVIDSVRQAPPAELIVWFDTFCPVVELDFLDQLFPRDMGRKFDRAAFEATVTRRTGGKHPESDSYDKTAFLPIKTLRCAATSALTAVTRSTFTHSAAHLSSRQDLP